MRYFVTEDTDEEEDEEEDTDMLRKGTGRGGCAELTWWDADRR
ncbi:hypothetical protein TPA0905_14550 [Streptomyces olivaceus]|nr:hypothetical protein TPA0905_14550 [Streptomyces olivaceus]